MTGFLQEENARLLRLVRCVHLDSFSLARVPGFLDGVRLRLLVDGAWRSEAMPLLGVNRVGWAASCGRAVATTSSRPSSTRSTCKFMSARRVLQVTRAPASRQTRAARVFKGQPRPRRAPDRAQATRWSSPAEALGEVASREAPGTSGRSKPREGKFAQ